MGHLDRVRAPGGLANPVLRHGDSGARGALPAGPIILDRRVGIGPAAGGQVQLSAGGSGNRATTAGPTVSSVPEAASNR
jgi:hypothetical protein